MDSNSREGEDVFDKLPDHLLHLIFNKIHDAKSLCNSLAVSKRFHSLVPQTHAVSLTLPHRRCTKITPLHLKSQCTNSEEDDSTKPTATRTSPKYYFLINRILKKLFLNPFKSLVQIATRKSSSRSHCVCEDEENTFDLVRQALKNFDSVKSLHIELPGHGEDTGPNLLKWKAEFGEKLESCVILGATSSYIHIPKLTNKLEKESASSSSSSSSSLSYFSEEELKVRVVWVISCLMAASARHYMVGEVVKEHREMKRAVISDGSKQGSICMNKRQVEEMRDSEREPGDVLMERSRVPVMSMKLWYVPELEMKLGGGSVMILKGATLVVLRPKEDGEKWGSDRDLVKGAFSEEDKVFREAAMKMVKKKRTYTLEMNSF